MQAWKQTFDKTADVTLLKQGSNFRYQTRFKCSPAKKKVLHMQWTALLLSSAHWLFYVSAVLF